jgi:hypothetical protein
MLILANMKDSQYLQFFQKARGGHAGCANCIRNLMMPEAKINPYTLIRLLAEFVDFPATVIAGSGADECMIDQALNGWEICACINEIVI